MGTEDEVGGGSFLGPSSLPSFPGKLTENPVQPWGVIG